MPIAEFLCRNRGHLEPTGWSGDQNRDIFPESNQNEISFPSYLKNYCLLSPPNMCQPMCTHTGCVCPRGCGPLARMLAEKALGKINLKLQENLWSQVLGKRLREHYIAVEFQHIKVSVSPGKPYLTQATDFSQ